MTTLTLDTHKAFKFLVEKGIPKDHAEGIVHIVQEIRVEEAATKSDVQVFKSELKEDMALLRSEFKEDIGNLKADIFKFVLVNTLAAVGATVTLIKVL